MEVLVKLGLTSSGNTYQRITKHIQKFKISTSHFNGHRKYTKELLEPIVEKSRSINQVLQVLGLGSNGGSHAHVSKVIKEFGLSTKHFSAGWPKGKSTVNKHTAKSLLDRVFILNGAKTPGYRLRRWMLELGLCEDKCAICGISSTWNKISLTLEVDHTNGNHRDNRPKNLRLLCPNCHSQQPTTGRKNGESKKQLGRELQETRHGGKR